ncbi:hypothetical protein acdb102_25980 [Acidothermaceae bacterium B102]|nr:hypothetical protein acdb102_25980 [Acidothermaceae bacterium B102]
MSSLTEPEVFALADRAIDAVVAQIADDQWAMAMPESFRTRVLDHTPTLREIVNYHAYDDAWIPDVLAGRTMAEVGVEAHKGDLLGDNPQAAFRAIVDRAVAAAEALDDLSRMVHLSYGDYTAGQYLWQANYFRGTRAYDLARVIGVEPALPDALVQGLWDELVPVADEWRAIGVMGAEVPVSADAPLLDRLLGLTGRDPSA